MFPELITKLVDHQKNGCVFTSCGDDWIIVFVRTTNTRTNEKRTCIVNRKFAKFMGSGFMVKDIIHKFDPSQIITSIIDADNKKYEIGNKTHGDSICFFVTFIPAHYHQSNKLRNGIHMKWGDDESLLSWVSYANARKHGKHMEFYDNGKRCYEQCFVHGVKDGVYRSWHYNGKISEYCEFADGEVNGKFLKQDHFGVKEYECEYNNGHVIKQKPGQKQNRQSFI
jgi:antitoxin component YwqK of YwqJK toxin-antitoxin module